VLDKIAAPDRNYPALFSALSDVLDALFEGKPREEALLASFEWATEGFGAEKAVILAVDATSPKRRALAHKGLADYEVIACEGGASVPGVSTTCIGEVVQSGRIVLIQDTSTPGGMTSGAFGRPYSVLCAPIVDNLGHCVAVLYLENDGVRNAFGEIDRAWIEVYARVLGRAMAGIGSRRSGPAGEGGQ
jgi:GAF domain-containing protein